MTKLVTWNCNMAFRKKKDRILQCDPNVLIIQECENPDVTGDWPEFSDWRWVGDNEYEGLCVFTRNGLSLELADVEGQGGRFTIPVAIDVLGVWAMNDEQNPETRYIGQVYTAVQKYREFIDSDAVVAGDFNWNVIWDESPKSPLCGNFSDTVHILNNHGLQSAYHAVNDSEFGSENEPTFFMHKKRDRPYHIDYVFLPEKSAETVSEFTIGTYDDWIDVSDHMPVMVDV